MQGKSVGKVDESDLGGCLSGRFLAAPLAPSDLLIPVDHRHDIGPLVSRAVGRNHVVGDGFTLRAASSCRADLKSVWFSCTAEILGRNARTTASEVV